MGSVDTSTLANALSHIPQPCENDIDLEPIRESHSQVDDCRIGYQRYGHGPENWIFICGGVGSYKKDYPEHVLRAFDPDLFTIVCLDPPGYATSQPPIRKQERTRCKKDAKYVIGLMKNLGLFPFSVLGWSEGGRTAVNVAHQARANCRRAVLIATTTRVDERGDQAFLGVRNTDQWMPQTKEPYLRHVTEDFLRVQWAAICDMVHDVYVNYGGRFPSDLVLNQLKLPVLLVYGGMDRFIMNQQELLSMLPNAREEVHAQGAHDFYVKYPRWLAMKVTTFVRDTPTGNEKL